MAVVCHEYAHGWVALKLGDPTARALGRLTLNPIKHLHWFGSIVLPTLLALLKLPVIGFAKPVPINPGYFARFFRDLMLVAIAGPVANFLLAALALLGWHALGSQYPLIYRLEYLPEEALFRDGVLMLALGLNFSVLINMILGLFNLIPIPPLDGSRILTFFLPDRGRSLMLRCERFGLVFLLVFVFASAFLDLRIIGGLFLPVLEWVEVTLLGVRLP